METLSPQKGIAQHRRGADNAGGRSLRPTGVPRCGVLVRISNPQLVDDLVRFLKRMGFTVDECDYDAVRVERLSEGAEAVLEARLQLYVQVWQATRGDVSAVVERVNDAHESRANP
jgi:hypothetical protein